jgi:hypothetical protein
MKEFNFIGYVFLTLMTTKGTNIIWIVPHCSLAEVQGLLEGTNSPLS